MRTFTLIALCAVLVGCTTTVGERVLQAGTTGSVRFNGEDVDAAIAIAERAKDTVAVTCFRAIRGHLDAGTEPVIKGPVSAYAAGRATRRELEAGLAHDVHVACAPLLVEGASFGARLRALLL